MQSTCSAQPAVVPLHITALLFLKPPMADVAINVTSIAEYQLPMPWSSVTSVLVVLGVAGNVLIIDTTLIKRRVKGKSSMLIGILAIFDLGSNVGMCLVKGKSVCKEFLCVLDVRRGDYTALQHDAQELLLLHARIRVSAQRRRDDDRYGRPGPIARYCCNDSVRTH